MAGDDAPEPAPAVANDNTAALDSAGVDAALTRIAEAIGRHIAREHLRSLNAANDNDGASG
jgi:hypothetical protein